MTNVVPIIRGHHTWRQTRSLDSGHQTQYQCSSSFPQDLRRGRERSCCQLAKWRGWNTYVNIFDSNWWYFLTPDLSVTITGTIESCLVFGFPEKCCKWCRNWPLFQDIHTLTCFLKCMNCILQSFVKHNCRMTVYIKN